jgi:hypothetical protein
MKKRVPRLLLARSSLRLDGRGAGAVGDGRNCVHCDRAVSQRQLRRGRGRGDHSSHLYYIGLFMQVDSAASHG